MTRRNEERTEIMNRHKECFISYGEVTLEQVDISEQFISRLIRMIRLL